MTPTKLTILDLPTEIRLAILEHVFSNEPTTHLIPDPTDNTLILNPSHRASTHLLPFLTSRQFYLDGTHLGLSRTTFLIPNLYHQTPHRLTTTLTPTQLTSLRHISLVVDARHFRQFATWDTHAFGIPSLSNLTTLTLILSRSGLHYLFDHTETTVHLLRRLQGVRAVEFVRNGARVKGSFRTWYNRLVGLILKVDHAERFARKDGRCIREGCWWEWGFDEVGQRARFEAREVKRFMEEGEYLEWVKPLVEELRVGWEREEWNPDPRARTMYY